MLGPSDADRAIKMSGYKRGIVYPGCIRDFEIVCILLKKVVAFHVRLTLIGFWGPNF